MDVDAENSKVGLFDNNDEADTASDDAGHAVVDNEDFSHTDYQITLSLSRRNHNNQKIQNNYCVKSTRRTKIM